MNKPFQSYFGGKGADGTYQKIINVMPPHDIYIEAFLGNGSIFVQKKQSEYSIGIDLDPAVITAWKKLGLSGLTLLNTDAIAWLENFQVPAAILSDLGIRILIYLDPPYPLEVRRSQRDRYLHELTTEQHTQLLAGARSIQANVVISSLPNDLYGNTLEDWNSFTFENSIRRGTQTEQLWYNYDTPAELHDYRYLGDNFRERERINGIIKRNTAKFKRMPAAERNALIENLIREGIFNIN